MVVVGMHDLLVSIMKLAQYPLLAYNLSISIYVVYPCLENVSTN